MTEPTAAKLTPVKQALLKIDALRRELNEVREAANEPIAVVGMGCRLPGGADSAAKLWEVLAAGTDAVSEVPAERWTDALFDPRPGRHDTSYSLHGAFIDDVDRFDPEFFGISGREARHIDPQQRLLLECSWRAIEDAGFTREAIGAYRTGVFVGSSLDDYARISELVPHADLSYAQTSLGTARPFAAGRISYLFGFHGPTLQLDTACSSSLVTVHLACQSLRNREADVALAGGVNLMLSPEMTIALCELQALSPDGRCKTFDAAANGYVRGEGCGIVALMRLSDARAQRRPIHAVIRGSAVNHDGRSNGMTAPNGRAQRDVIRDALIHAGVAPDEVDYVEAHGTGTLLGDPIELRALQDIYCRDANRKQDLYVGSIKTNMGHLEAAASVSGLMKVICSLQKGEIPKHLHMDTPTPHVDWQSNGIKVVTQHMVWPSSRPGKRVAAISSFGMSGTNAHLIIEAWRDDEADEATAPRDPGIATFAQQLPGCPEIFPISAHTSDTLSRAVAGCTAYLRANPSVEPGDFAHSLRAGRDTQRHRIALVAGTREQLLDALAKAEHASVVERSAQTDEPGKLAFLFTGQGAQYAGMARQLYQTFPLFREVLDECDAHFEALGEHSLIDVLWGDRQTLIHETRYTQPAMFAVEMALARLWMDWGIVPDVLMGHSVGEYAAACLAGVFSLADACRLVVVRGHLMETMTPPGKMLAVLTPAARLAGYLGAFTGRVEIAADNGPSSVVVSGDPAGIDELSRQLERDGIPTRALIVSRAFHSPLMEPMLDAFGEITASIDYRPPRIRIVSNVSGIFEAERYCDPAYWVEHVRATVNFRQGVGTLSADGVQTFIEIGPGKTLTRLAKACCAAQGNARAVSALQSFGDAEVECEQLLGALGHVYTAGRRVDWAAFECSRAQSIGPRRIALPPYPLESGSYWIGSRQAADRARPLSSARAAVTQAPNSLLGQQLLLPALDGRRYENRLVVSDLPFLEGHVVHGGFVFPAAGFIEIVLDAARRGMAGSDADGTPAPWLHVQELSFDNPLVLERQRPVLLGTVVHAAENVRGAVKAARAQLEIFARNDIDADLEPHWVNHCSAWLPAVADSARADHDTPSLPAFQHDCADVLPVDRFYERLRGSGLAYDGAFRSIRSLWRGDDAALARIELDASHACKAARSIHPALLDSCFQTVAAALWDAGLKSAYVPIGINRIACQPIPDTRAVWCAVRVKSRRHLISADLWLYDDAGQCVASIAHLQLIAVDPRKFNTAPSQASLYSLAWRPMAVERARPLSLPACLLVGGAETLDEEIAAQLRAVDADCHVVRQSADASDGDDESVRRFRKAFSEGVSSAGSPAPVVILYVWPHGSADQDTANTPTSEEELDQVAGAYRRFANFWRAVQATDWAGRPLTVCLVTQSAQCIQGHDRLVVPAQAAAWGVARSLMHESGDIRVLVADLPGADAASCEAMLSVISESASTGETQFAVRGHEVFVPRLVRRNAPAMKPLARGAWLVTGGRGAIGTRLIEWLIAKGMPKIISVSRQLPAEAERGRLAKLAQTRDATLEFRTADIASSADVEELIKSIEADAARPLKGILHAAGALEDGLLLTQPMSSVMKVLTPKIAGTQNLHRATAHLSVHHFVSFSSIVSCIGSPGQCAYAAANAYLDALSLGRNEEGLSGHVMNWGLWGGKGMAEQLDAQQLRRIEAYGLKALDPDAALQALDALMAERQGQSQIWSVDVDTLLKRSTSRSLRPLLKEIADAPSHAAVPAAGTSSLAQRLAGLPEGDREAALRDHLIGEIAATLQVARDRVSPGVALIELGLDSLMAAEFRNALRNELGVDIPFGRLLEGATLNDIVRTIIGTMSGGSPAPEAPRVRRAAADGLDIVSGEVTFGVEMEGGEL